MLNTADVLKQFVADYSKAVANKTGLLPQVCHDPQWCSPCEQSEVKEGEMVSWQWQNQGGSLNFNDLEQALELSFHPDIKAYYNSIYCGPVFASVEQQQIELLQVWNDQDFERLSQNIIGHILMQRRLKQDYTVFIGCIVNGEQMLCIDNQTGQIILEVAGDKKRTVLAQSLAEFLTQAQPLTEPEPELAYQEPQALKAGLMPRLKEIFNSLRGR
jgi:SecY interacting protein Syd